MEAMHKISREKFVIKIIQRRNNDSSRILSELQLQSLIEPNEHNGLISLVDHIVDNQFEYLVRPFYSLGSICGELKTNKARQLSEQELRHGA